MKHEIIYLPIGKLKPNPDNPRLIRDANFKRLVKSLKDCPQLFDARPCICSDRTGDLIVLGGNMRLMAAKELKYSEVPVIVMSGLTPDQEREIVIKDNGENFGEWDFDLLANWSDEPLKDWGVDLPDDWLKEPVDDENKSIYTNKIIAPIYEPKGEKPKLSALIDRNKTKELIKEIDDSSLPSDIAEFLKIAAERHTVFNFRQIAEYYCHADKTVQNLMEKSGMVIIDFNKAIEYGFVHMTEKLGELADLECEDA